MAAGTCADQGAPIQSNVQSKFDKRSLRGNPNHRSETIRKRMRQETDRSSQSAIPHKTPVVSSVRLQDSFNGYGRHESAVSYPTRFESCSDLVRETDYRIDLPG